jgi:hypothetical protein
MKTYTNKTQPTLMSPEKYLKEKLKGKEKVQADALELIALYTKVTGSPCVMWNKIFGFGKYHYLDSKGGEHTHLVTGFAVPSTGFTLYNMMGWEAYSKEIALLGKYKLSGKSCLAIKSIDDIDLKVLKMVIKKSLADMKKKYKTEK